MIEYLAHTHRLDCTLATEICTEFIEKRSEIEHYLGMHTMVPKGTNVCTCNTAPPELAPAAPTVAAEPAVEPAVPTVAAEPAVEPAVPTVAAEPTKEDQVPTVAAEPAKEDQAPTVAVEPAKKFDAAPVAGVLNYEVEFRAIAGTGHSVQSRVVSVKSEPLGTDMVLAMILFQLEPKK
jgi:hypothetical protein